jgi:LmbE family N-acetylglucosaminyl deacetylase
MIRGTVLILSPHPDDAEWGCGGTLAAREDLDVIGATFSNCYESLPPGTNIHNEQRAALNLLKPGFAPKMWHFQYPVRRFSEKRQQILDSIINLRKNVKPDVVMFPCSADVHQDHQVIHREAVRAFYRHGVTLLGYELPWNTPGFIPQLYVPLQEEHLARKIAALECYRSQQQRPYFDPEYIRASARTHGIDAATRWAEAFEVIRAVN